MSSSESRSTTDEQKTLAIPCSSCREILLLENHSTTYPLLPSRPHNSPHLNHQVLEAYPYLIPVSHPQQYRQPRDHHVEINPRNIRFSSSFIRQILISIPNPFQISTIPVSSASILIKLYQPRILSKITKEVSISKLEILNSKSDCKESQFTSQWVVDHQL